MKPPGILEEKTQCVPGRRQTAVRLRHAGVSNSHGDSLQRKLKNVVQRAERGRQRDAGPSRHLRRKERQRRWFVAQRERSAAIVFPVQAEAHAMSGPLPGQVIIEMVSPGKSMLV